MLVNGFALMPSISDRSRADALRVDYYTTRQEGLSLHSRRTVDYIDGYHDKSIAENVTTLRRTAFCVSPTCITDSLKPHRRVRPAMHLSRTSNEQKNRHSLYTSFRYQGSQNIKRIESDLLTVRHKQCNRAAQ